MDILRRALAPIADEGWEYLDKQAADVLKTQLSARTLVDFSGPHGLGLGAVNLGRLDVSAADAAGQVPWGVRRVQPLVEMRIPFTILKYDSQNPSISLAFERKHARLSQEFFAPDIGDEWRRLPEVRCHDLYHHWLAQQWEGGAMLKLDKELGEEVH